MTEGENIRVLVLEPDAEKARQLIEVLGRIEDIEPVGEPTHLETAVQQIEELEPTVLMVGAGMANVYQRTRQFTLQFPRLSAVFILFNGDSESFDFRAALRAGARDVVRLPMPPLELADVVYDAHEYARRLAGVAPAQHAAQRPEQSEPERKAVLWTLFSTKGGVGVTTLAVNLAVALAQNRKERVALWDMDLAAGNDAICLNVEPKRPMHELVNETGILDEDLLSSYMVEHESGVHVLPALSNPEFAEYFSSEHLERVYKVMAGMYDYVIADTACNFGEQTLAVLDPADLILLVTTPSLPAVANMKTCINVMETLNYSQTKLRLVLNRYNQGYGVKSADVETTLDLKIFAQLSVDDRAVRAAVNQGEPVVTGSPRARYSRGVKTILRKLTHAEGARAGLRRVQRPAATAEQREAAAGS